jgi:heat-inducible transcriptional repressor
MHNYLNEHFSGLTVAKVRQEILLEMKRQQTQYNDLLAQALLLGERALSETERDVFIDGQTHLFTTPEFSTIERMQQILKTLEEKTLIMKVLDQCLSSPGVKIFIGDEAACAEINGLTLITSSYSDSDGKLGVLGVIGPTRLDYARIVPLVDFTSQLITDVFQERKT